MEPIAIIGLAFRLPDGVEDELSLWDMLKHGRNVMREWPKDRTNIETFFKPGSGAKNTASLAKRTPIAGFTMSANKKRKNQLYSKGGYFMNGNPAAFDAPFFSITPQGMNEAARLQLVNPNADTERQRLLRWTHSNDGFLRLLTGR
jgi:acyl transferase domain-containing protein